MAFFFARLPTDLQVCITAMWIADDANERILLHALSALDVACCCKSLRQPFLLLANHPAMPWLNHRNLVTSNPMKGIADVVACMAWVASRKIGFQPALLLRMDNRSRLLEHASKGGTLPIEVVKIECLDLGGEAGKLESVLQACPSMTALHGGAGDGLWEALGNSTLKHLQVFSHECGLIPSEQCVLRALQAVGQQLQELRIGKVLLTAAVQGYMTGCKHLQVLEVSLYRTPVGAVLAIMQACQQLADLTMNGFVGELSDLDSILTAGGDQLKAIAVHTFTADVPFWLDGFVHAVQRYPSLEAVEFGHCKYTRKTQLAFAVYGLCNFFGLHNLQRVLAVCSHVKQFTANAMEEDAQWMAAVADKCAHNLQDIHLYVCPFASAKGLLEMCSGLTKLVLRGDISDAALQHIAQHCQQLRTLSLISYHCGITDAGMEALFSNCSKLKDLVLQLDASKVTYRTLQCMLDRMLLLDRMTCCTGKLGFNAKDMEQFRALAKEKGLLPVPQLVIADGFKGGAAEQ